MRNGLQHGGVASAWAGGGTVHVMQYVEAHGSKYRTSEVVSDATGLFSPSWT
ncbi:MAG: hypothetical protein ACXVIG_08415 [Halobacteriota archaeon]